MTLHGEVEARMAPFRAQERRRRRRENWIAAVALAVLAVGLAFSLRSLYNATGHEVARRAAWDAWRQEQTETLQELAEDVRRLREMLEERR